MIKRLALAAVLVGTVTAAAQQQPPITMPPGFQSAAQIVSSYIGSIVMQNAQLMEDTAVLRATVADLQAKLKAAEEKAKPAEEPKP